MNERILSMQVCLINPNDAAAAAAQYFEALTDMRIVGVSAAPSKDDAGALLAIGDDGSAVITGIDMSDNNVPGTWQAKGYGGTNAVVDIAKDSLVSLTPTVNAVATSFNVTILYLAGEDWK